MIFQEIGAARDVPDDVVFDHFTETAFRSVAWSLYFRDPKTIQSFTSADLQFHDKQYSADRMIVVAAGAVQHENFLQEVESRLSTFSFSFNSSSYKPCELCRWRFS
ncbi:Uncharacterised protein [Candidatus Bartonella washoeensis]|nr:Uncharacterised protein [Bartonella washoeensis]